MRRRQSDRPLAIGAVLAAVQAEFPEITISKIRYLEAEGLLHPDRSASGYRQYTPEHVDRLRYILRAQRDHFWPLRVIRDALDALDRGLEPRTDAADSRPRVPLPPADPDLDDIEIGVPMPTGERAIRLTRSELATAVGLTDATLGALEDSGLLLADPSGHFDEFALRVAHAVAGLTGFGLEPRHLRAFRTTADREIGLIQQVVAGRPHSTKASDTVEVTALVLQLHAALLKAGLGHG